MDGEKKYVNSGSSSSFMEPTQEEPIMQSSSRSAIRGSDVSLVGAGINIPSDEEDFVANLVAVDSELESLAALELEYTSEFSNMYDELESESGGSQELSQDMKVVPKPRTVKKKVAAVPPVKRQRKINKVAPPGGAKLDAKVLRVRPVRQMGQRQVVPDEMKDEDYFEHRRRNTEAARKCREAKRALDQRRVEIIKAQADAIQKYKRENARLEQNLKFCTNLLLQRQQP